MAASDPSFVEQMLNPSIRTRSWTLLLLATLVSAMLYLGSRPGVEVIVPHPPWDKLAHLIVFGGYALLATVALGGRSRWGPLLIVGAISLMDEGMQYYSPGRTADPRDIVADLAGAALVVLLVKLVQSRYRVASARGVTPWQGVDTR